MTTIAVLSAIIDIACLYIYMNGFFRKRASIRPIVEMGCYVLMELILNLNVVWNHIQTEYVKSLLTGLLSVFTTFLLSFLYQGNLAHRIFVTISYQVYADLCENVTVSLFTYTNPKLLNSQDMFGFSIPLLTSKVFLFMLVILTVMIFKRNHYYHTLKYSVLVLITPIMSIIFYQVISSAELINPDSSSVYFILEWILFGLNILNYYLLENILKNNELSLSLKEKELQLNNQRNNFENLSSLYKSGRSVIHDTKKHYLYMRECLKNKEYDKLEQSVNHCINDLDTKYIVCNTGNLVIDTFISHYTDMAQKYGITFRPTIKLLSMDIPIEDYDHCIVLGNMLDNCLNACKQLPDNRKRYIDIEITTVNEQYIIKTKNPYPENQDTARNMLHHGYGLHNIQSVAESYSGVFSNYIEQEEFIAVAIIPIFRDTDGFVILHKKQP
ncbi:MAG: GHKL domain-containing protein [Wujia sp.]